MQRVFASLRGHGISKQELPHAVHIYAKEVDELTFGLAMTRQLQAMSRSASPQTLCSIQSCLKLLMLERRRHPLDFVR